MEIMRCINGEAILVETGEACGIQLNEKLLSSVSVLNGGVPELQKSHLLRLLAHGDTYKPLSVRWELLDKCNFKCGFCYIVGHSFNQVVRLSAIRSKIVELIDEGMLFCTLTGGEATIHPDFLEIYTLLKENGVVVELFTNGLCLGDELIEVFRTLPPAAVEVSLYSLSNQRLRDLYKVKHETPAETVLQNVLKLKRNSIEVVCKTFVNTHTESELELIENWCNKNQVEFYSSREFTQAYDNEDISLYRSTSGASSSVVLLRRDEKPKINLPCGTKNYGAAINSNFEIFPCPSIRLPDCTFNLQNVEVQDAITGMKSFMRRLQDQEISGSGAAGCMAYASPVRDNEGKIVRFES